LNKREKGKNVWGSQVYEKIGHLKMQVESKMQNLHIPLVFFPSPRRGIFDFGEGLKKEGKGGRMGRYG
jgi:hypothetical protein